jgi:hypothetical protein
LIYSFTPFLIIDLVLAFCISFISSFCAFFRNILLKAVAHARSAPHSTLSINSSTAAFIHHTSIAPLSASSCVAPKSFSSLYASWFSCIYTSLHITAIHIAGFIAITHISAIMLGFSATDCFILYHAPAKSHSANNSVILCLS